MAITYTEEQRELVQLVRDVAQVLIIGILTGQLVSD